MNYFSHSIVFVALFLVLQVTSQYDNDIPITRFGSRYWKKWNEGAIDFDTAQQSCRQYGGSLVIFPSSNEAQTLWDLMTLDLKLNINGEQASMHLYWIGMKYKDEDIYWMNAENSVIIPRSKWTPIAKLPIDSAVPTESSGCMAIQFSWNAGSKTVSGLLKKVLCTSNLEPVKSYMCEKRDSNHPNFEYWSTWEPWSENNCQKADSTTSDRQRMCYGYNCELRGLPVQTQTKACCPMLDNVIIDGYYLNQFGPERAAENQTAELNCQNGFVHPETRYHMTTIKCVMGEEGAGVWSPTATKQCVPVECGIPPLGVHALAPQYTGTKFQDVVTYRCQPGFREPKNNETSVTLRCADSDAWVGIDFDPNTKAVCEPIQYILLDWVHYPLNEEETSGTDHCYRLHHLGKTWKEASEICEGSLLYLTNDEEFNFLVFNILEPQAERSVLWLAGKKKKEETSFNWYLTETRTTPLTDYQNWDEGGAYDQHYHRDLCIAANYSDGEWKWTNQTCDNKFEFVCKTLRQKVHGNWSEWTEWTPCDRHFIRERSHVCNNPVPVCGGDPCEGEVTEKSHCCQDPGEAPNAAISYRSITNETVFLLPGHYYTYECNLGYEHDDGRDLKNITCQLDGSWSEPGTAPPCSPKLCEDPDNGTYSYYIKTDPTTIYYHESSITYDCLYGFAVGKTANANQGGLLRCDNGQWDQPPLQCFARVCEAGDRTELADVEYDTRNIERDYVRHPDEASHESWGWEQADNDTDLYKDIYQYFCKSGYRVNDRIDYNITCMYNGDWKRGITDTTLHPDRCEPVKCLGPPPLPITNSLWVGGSDPYDPNILGEYLDEALYNCSVGYQVNTGLENDERIILKYTFTCGANNDWKDRYSPDHCKKQSCGDPGPGINVENRIGRSFLYGDTIDYVCKRGFIFSNTITRRRLLCELPEGEDIVAWNDTALNCSKVVCGDPGSGSNVTKEGTKYVYGGIVTYTCVPQHVLTGGGLEKQWIRCTSQGTWNGSAPSCEPAKIASDFIVRTFKPYAVEAQWIMSEKYKGIQTTFNIEFMGNPGYVNKDGTYSYIQNVSALISHSYTFKKITSASGLIRVFIHTHPEYIYQFKLHSQTKVSTEMWPPNEVARELYTGGGLPFLGAVQEANLPNIIPLHLLPRSRKRPTALPSGSPDSMGVEFDRNMFSEQNGTIIGFTIIVKEVHPWHVSDTLMYREGYHDRFPETLYTWRELEVFTKYKYITWPAYYVFPVCNIYDPTKKCNELIGESPGAQLDYSEGNGINTSIWRESIYSNFPSVEQLPEQKIHFHIGIEKNCEKYDAKFTCNGPLRRNRKFCVKLRAFTRYGYNDSECSNWIAVDKQLEFDEALIAPTALAALPFALFFAIMFFQWCRQKWSSSRRADDDAEHDNVEGELIGIWTAQAHKQRSKGYLARERRQKSGVGEKLNKIKEKAGSPTTGSDKERGSGPKGMQLLKPKEN